MNNPETITKRDKISLLIGLTNRNNNALVMLKSRLTSNGLVSVEMIDKFAKQFDEAMDLYNEKQVDVYDKWLTEEAVDGVLAFYSSEAGTEVLNNMPHIIQGLAQISAGMMDAIFDGIPNPFDSESGEEFNDKYDAS